MTCGAVCLYCLGAYHPESIHSVTCGASCRQATSRARRLANYAAIEPSSLRREGYCYERRDATGFGLITTQVAYLADHRVRIAGAPVADPIETDTQRESLAVWAPSLGERWREYQRVAGGVLATYAASMAKLSGDAWDADQFLTLTNRRDYALTPFRAEFDKYALEALNG